MADEYLNKSGLSRFWDKVKAKLEKKGVELTQAEYDALDLQGKIDPNTDYYITDGQLGDVAIADSIIALDSTWSSNKINSLLGLKVKKLQSSTYTANGSNTYRYYLQQMFNELVTAVGALDDNEYLWMDSIYMGIQLQQNRNHFYKKGDTIASMTAYGIYINSAGTQTGMNIVTMSSTLTDCKRYYTTFTLSNNSVNAADASTGVPEANTKMYLNYYILYV